MDEIIATNTIHPSTFEGVNDLWVVSCYFNPMKYKIRQKNFDIFYKALKGSNINYTIVECSYKNEPYKTRKDKNVIQLKSNSILWQKERLLNIAINALPDKCKKVVWLDCDVLFTNPYWAVETSALLEKYKIVQPFDKAIWLPKNHDFYSGEGIVYPGFSKCYKDDPSLGSKNIAANHGHTGFAWAGQKEILQKHGLYEGCLSGVADHYMAHAFFGDWDGDCIKRHFKENNFYYRHYKKWSEAIYADVKSEVSYTNGTILHLWHGALNRSIL
jgi:hypothetical protein